MALDVQIEKLVYGGRGLARWNGRVVLAPFVLPGEKVVVEPERESADLIQARTVRVEAAADWRVAAPCPYFGRCGGCDYQHLPYDRQLEAKREILIETLARVGKISWTGPVEIIAAEPWGYRNRAQLHLRKHGTRFEIGYHERGSHRLCPIESCPIASPQINRAVAALARMGPDRRFPDFLRQVELFTNEKDVLLTVLDTARPLGHRFFDWCGNEIEGFSPSSFLDYPAGADLLRAGVRSFFQVNRFLAGRLPEVVLRDHSGGLAVDLYAGVGLLSLPLARRFSRVLAVDSSRSAALDLDYNAQRAGLPIEVHQGPAERVLESIEGPVDLLVADPPRAGLGRMVTASLAALRPRRLVVASCDPATLARDLRALLDAEFRVVSVKLVDLFPQTFHIESVVELQSG